MKATPQSPNLQSKISTFLSNFSEGNFYTNGKTRTFIAGIEIPHHDEARKISLRNFHEMTPEDQQKTIDKFQLQSDINAIGQAVFFQKLSEVNEEVLDLVTLVDLKTNIKTSRLKYILLNDDEFKAVTLRQLDNESLVFSLRQLSHEYLDQTRNVFLRVNLIDQESQKTFVLLKDFLDLNVIHFQHLTADTIMNLLLRSPLLFFIFYLMLK